MSLAVRQKGALRAKNLFAAQGLLAKSKKKKWGPGTKLLMSSMFYTVQ